MFFLSHKGRGKAHKYTRTKKRQKKHTHTQDNDVSRHEAVEALMAALMSQINTVMAVCHVPLALACAALNWSNGDQQAAIDNLGNAFSKVLYVVPGHSPYTGAMTFEHLSQPLTSVT